MAAGLGSRKKQRFVIVGVALVVLMGAVLLVLFALGGDSLSLFLNPSAAVEKNMKEGQRFRLGGLVKDGSYTKQADGLTFNFTVTDCEADIPVSYHGILPDLFREGQGVVTDGAFDASGVFIAETVLAKHDENYAAPGTMPENTDGCKHPEERASSGP